MGLLRDARITRRQDVLPATAGQENKPLSSPTTAGQPARRHPERLLENPHPLRRTHRLGPPQNSRSLTSKNLGCLPRAQDRARRPPAPPRLVRLACGGETGGLNWGGTGQLAFEAEMSEQDPGSY